MPRINCYFSESEYAHIKEQPTGYVGSLVRGDMFSAEVESQEIMKATMPELETLETLETMGESSNGKTSASKPEDVGSIPTLSANTTNVCKKCGSLLLYYGAKCQRC